MKPVRWSEARSFEVALTPVGQPTGRKPETATLCAGYGPARLRLVQFVGNRVGGDAFYADLVVHAQTPENRHVVTTVPVAGWRQADMGSALEAFGNVLNAAASANLDVVVYGGRSRERWLLEVKSESTRYDAFDNVSEGATERGAGECKDPSGVEPNGMRVAF